MSGRGNHRRHLTAFWRVLLILFCVALSVAAAEAQPADLPAPRGDFDFFLFFGLILLVVACFLALLLGIFAALILAGVIKGGIISASVAAAVFQRSVSSGFRALFLQVGAVVGLLTGAVGAMIFIWLAKVPSGSPQPWVIGVLAGLVWGVLSACLFNFAWGRIVEWISG